MPAIFDLDVEPGRFQAVDSERGEPLELSMQQLVLAGRILPVGARLVVRHTFSTSGKRPVEAVYSFMLPRDAALRRFRITGPGFSARSELRPVAEATAAYEKGLEDGHLATLARADRDGVVNLSVGNLRPNEPVTVWLELLAGVDLRDDGLRFRFPFTLAPSYHAQARSVLVDENAGEIELPEGEFGDVLLPQFRATGEGLHEVGFDLAVDVTAPSVEVSSPSHSIRARMSANGCRVSSSSTADQPDRDLVLDVGFARQAPQVLAGQGSDGRTQFAATVPSREFGEPAGGPRSVVFLLDRSGSMQGAPIKQARRALLACLATLSDSDEFAIVAFDNEIEPFESRLLSATTDNRDRARKWLNRIDARGGTELAQGVLAATKMAAVKATDVFILTDGQVWGTEKMLATVRGSAVRLHTLGIGSASQDRFLTLLARETDGVSRFVTPRERVDASALEWFASVTSPVATGLSVTAPDEVQIEPQPPSSLFAGTPLLLTGSSVSADGDLSVTWDKGSTDISLTGHTPASGETLRLLRGSRLITDAESHVADTETAVARRQQGREVRRLRRLSEEYGLASREMALVAVCERAGDRPGEVPETRVVPVAMPADMVMDKVFPAAGMVGSKTFTLGESAVMDFMSVIRPAPGALLSRRRVEDKSQDDLFDLASQLEPDGGMRGPDEERRILASILALLAFVAGGNTETSGPLRTHITRLTQFLEAHLPGPLSPEQESAVRGAMHRPEVAKAVVEDWVEAARSVSEPTTTGTASHWRTLQEAFGVD